MTTRQELRRARLEAFGVDRFYYFCRLQNVTQILNHGLLPKDEVEKRGLPSQSFAEETVQTRRHRRHVTLSNGKKTTIHGLVPVYLTPRTPTLYSRRKIKWDICFLDIGLEAVCDAGTEFAFSDGNCASQDTYIYNSLDDLKQIPWEVLRTEFWNEHEDGVRQRNAEFLIYPYVKPACIRRLVVMDV